jgi:serine/threonine protein kinase
MYVSTLFRASTVVTKQYVCAIGSAQAVIYRDLKPENILLDGEVRPFLVYLICVFLGELTPSAYAHRAT